jgi:hypothetical protein
MSRRFVESEEEVMSTIDPSEYVVKPGDTIRDVDLDTEDVRLPDGRRLTEELADQLVEEARADQRPAYTVTVVPWAQGLELHIDGVGVTQTDPGHTDAELMVRECISLTLDVPMDSFDVEFMTTTDS